MPRKGMPHTKTVRARGKAYTYFRTGQTNPAGNEILVRLPAPSAPQFGAVYASLMAQKTRRIRTPDELTVPQLWQRYEESPKFRKLSDGTRRIYRKYLDSFARDFATAPAGRLERRDVLQVFNRRAGTPGAANLLVASIRAMYAWGRENESEHIANDPCKDISLHELGEHEPWPDDLLKAALEAEDDIVRLATHLLFYTAQRIGDVVRMAGAHVRGDTISVRQEKTGKELEIRLHAALKAELARHPLTLGPLIRQSEGKGFAAYSVRTKLQKFAAQRGYKIVAHGLRKNAVIALLEVGCSVAETAAISGQTFQLVEYYARRRNQAALGSAAILKWEQRR